MSRPKQYRVVFKEDDRMVGSLMVRGCPRAIVETLTELVSMQVSFAMREVRDESSGAVEAGLLPSRS